MTDVPRNDDIEDEVSAVFGTHLPNPPSRKQQAWGAVISIVVIVLMVVVGAFYAWGKRIAQQQPLGTVPADQLVQ
ncbi:MAG: hypothetical protein WC030_02065 [Candidatus Paceibacterota bacterium]